MDAYDLAKKSGQQRQIRKFENKAAHIGKTLATMRNPDCSPGSKHAKPYGQYRIHWENKYVDETEFMLSAKQSRAVRHGFRDADNAKYRFRNEKAAGSRGHPPKRERGMSGLLSGELADMEETSAAC